MQRICEGRSADLHEYELCSQVASSAHSAMQMEPGKTQIVFLGGDNPPTGFEGMLPGVVLNSALRSAPSLTEREKKRWLFLFLD